MFWWILLALVVVFIAVLLVRAARFKPKVNGRAAAAPCEVDAAAAVEQMCDQIELELQGHFPGCSFPFRYSPGYGDLPLELQNPLLDLLDAPRRVGLCASASHILTPRKSVTAILGAADGPIQPTVRSCLGCPARESCQYRKSGGHCGIS